MNEPEAAQPGENSIAEVAKILLLWGSDSAGGFCRVEMVDEEARRRVAERVGAGLREKAIPFEELELPKVLEPNEKALQLVELLRGRPPGVVSIQGFGAAFSSHEDRARFLQALNFQREQLARPGLRQIWWMPVHIGEEFSRQVPDLDSWFQVRLTLAEVAPRARDPFAFGLIERESTWASAVSPVGPIEARALLAEAKARLEKAAEAGKLDPRVGRRMLNDALGDLRQAGAHAEADEEEKGLRQQFPELWAQFDIFLCHDSADRDAVEKIARQLQDAGLVPWLGEWQNTPGQTWRVEPERQLSAIGAVAFFVGPSSYRPWQDPAIAAVLRELAERGSLVVPVLLPGASEVPELPRFLAGRAWVDFRQAEPPPLEQLVWSITGKKPQERLLDWYDERITADPSAFVLTWSRSFEQLKPGAQALLKVLAHLAPEPIPQVMLEQGAEILHEAAGGEFDLTAALVDLQRYSLVKREQEGEQKTITPHRLVQAVVLDRIVAEEKAVWCERAVRLVNDFAPNDGDDVRTWPIWEPLRPHASRVIELAEGCGVSQPTATLMNNLALFLFGKGLYNKAEPLMRRSLAIGEVSFGKELPNVAAVLNNLAQLLQATHRYAEAEPLMRRALAIDEASFGKEHPSVARDLNNLAQLLHATHRHAEAEPLMRRALAVDEASFGKEHLDVAIDLNNLALLLQGTHRLAEAEPLMRRSLAIFEASLGDEHPRTKTVRRNLARLLAALEELAK